MAFDKDTRNLLAKAVSACRRRLIEDVTDQLRGVFGLHPDGTVLPLDKLTYLSSDQAAAARRLRELLDHYTAGAAGTESERRKAAYERVVLEISFTVLNRLAALRLCEERGLTVECVRKGMSSDGFQMFERISGGVLGVRYETYRVFLECLFDELALDLGVLFDRTTPQSAVFPTERCMVDVLSELNKAELTHLWTEDETIGWVYQYFNPPEERKAMREASQAPRNSRELAVRNQFFTPRYVVEFLTDNTLGRIWYEMQKGDTALREDCRYLVRRPNEIFLAPGERAPAQTESKTDRSQEELLKQPFYIEHRPRKDPRDLRVLDPACGSGHFLLYAFDVLERIYEEAWQDSESPKSEVTGRGLREEFGVSDDLRRVVPKLIIEHNLHGIDIDPRAVQIAALALWLRAQKTWKDLGIKPAERPQINRSNIVTAEPMPGEDDMRREFTAGLKPRVLGQLVDVVFEKMKLAGEAGSLLKIEDEIRDAVGEARKQWLEDPKPEQLLMFPERFPKTPKQVEMRFDLKGVTHERFWEQAEDRILDALKDYAERAENGRAVSRRLFAEDAARGFALIDLCRKRYDVVLMNPPFGEYPSSLRRFSADVYQYSKSDIGFSMMTRGAELSNEFGYAAALLSRLFIVNDSVALWRELLLASECSIDTMLDLGYGVLDGAMVEVAALCIRKRSKTSEHAAFFLRVLDEQDKELAVDKYFGGSPFPRTFAYLSMPSSFKSFKKTLLCYWLPKGLANALKCGHGLAEAGADAHFGASTSDDFQFARLRWEVTPEHLKSRWWVPFAKGGEYSPFFGDIDLVLEWRDEGRRLKEFVDRKSFETQGAGGWTRWINGVEFYFKEGLTYPERTTSDLCPQVLPMECIFSAIGSAIHFPSRRIALSYLGTAFTRPFKVLADAIVGSGDSSVSGSAARHYRPGIVNSLPLLCDGFSDSEILSVESCVNLTRERFCSDETSSNFTEVDSLTVAGDLVTWAANRERSSLERSVEIIELCAHLEDSVIRALGLADEDITAIEADFGPHPAKFPRELDSQKSGEIRNSWTEEESTLIARAVLLQGARRQLTKKTYLGDRRLELVANIHQIHPASVLDALAFPDACKGAVLQKSVRDLLSYSVGCLVGRWDLRINFDSSLVSRPLDPFTPLPVCPPGMLVGPDGLPAEPNRIVSEEWLRARPDANVLPPDGSVKTPTIPDSDYPLRISWEGILVDDPGFNGDRPHRDDIVRRVREMLDLLWKDKAQEIEQEVCDILGVSDLRDYFRKPSGFFQDHLKRYSKSRRKAPIYWPLSTASGSYSLWLYYHRLTDQTLFAAVNKYIEPKITDVERGIASIEDDLKAVSGRDATRLTDRLIEARSFLGELRDLREELLRIAALPFKPNLNDGVIINAAPLHKLFRLRSWAKDTEDCWRKLDKGDYDWAHLAYTIWPDRVRDVCKHDRSIAIAHGLEDLCEIETVVSQKKTKRRKES